MIRPLILTLLLTLPLVAVETHSPQIPYSPMESEEILAPHLKGIILADSKPTLDRFSATHTHGIKFANLEIPAFQPPLALLLDEYIGKPVTLRHIAEIKKSVIEYYRRHNHPIVYVEVPSQTISSGVLELVVYEGKLANVTSTGNKHFKSDRLIGYVRNKPNEPIDMDELVKDLEWMNRNPFRQTNSIFSPSSQNGMTDIELVTEDRFPLRVYGGVDNTGIRQAGRTRFFTGFNWGNAFGLDHILSFQFTSGTDINHYWSTSLHYTAPCSWRHTMVFYGGYSHIKAPLSTPGMHTKGYSAQGSFRYELPLPTFPNYLEDFLWGFDYKRTNTSLDQDGDLFFDQSVNITQLVVGYNAGYEGSFYKVSGTVELFYSPGEWLPDQSCTRYQDLRPGANNTYVYSRIAIAPYFTLPLDFAIHSKIRGQISSTNLLASEQFGLGGWDTVRGYQTREVNADNVFILNLELRTPPIGVMRYHKKKIKDELIFLAFWDYAYGRNHEVFPGEVDHNNIMGVGPGVRYNIPPYIAFRGDLAYKVWQPEQSDNRTRWRFEFGLIASY